MEMASYSKFADLRHDVFEVRIFRYLRLNTSRKKIVKDKKHGLVCLTAHWLKNVDTTCSEICRQTVEVTNCVRSQIPRDGPFRHYCHGFGHFPTSCCHLFLFWRSSTIWTTDNVSVNSLRRIVQYVTEIKVLSNNPNRRMMGNNVESGRGSYFIAYCLLSGFRKNVTGGFKYYC